MQADRENKSRSIKGYSSDLRNFDFQIFTLEIFQVTTFEFTISYLDYKVKMFYVSKEIRDGTSVSKGGQIGTMINMAAQYGRGMTNHIHVELEKNGKRVDPTPYKC